MVETPEGCEHYRATERPECSGAVKKQKTCGLTLTATRLQQTFLLLQTPPSSPDSYQTSANLSPSPNSRTTRHVAHKTPKGEPRAATEDIKPLGRAHLETHSLQQKFSTQSDAGGNTP
ncbi:hypothetical protein RRG08_020423 [Elysia crispata]|uniref:Uncharacterized protein n=1 Tax=Elysia crispata TaxID=231223 RepID=A0AAE1B4U3_9GAST|nr:hypothetical protein RRG08_020423 [Elysia crispata]